VRNHQTVVKLGMHLVSLSVSFLLNWRQIAVKSSKILTQNLTVRTTVNISHN